MDENQADLSTHHITKLLLCFTKNKVEEYERRIILHRSPNYTNITSNLTYAPELLGSRIILIQKGHNLYHSKQIC